MIGKRQVAKLVGVLLLVVSVTLAMGMRVSSAADLRITGIAQQLEKKMIANTVQLSAEDWFEKGCKFQDKQDLENAIQAFNKAIQLNIKFAEAYNNRGNAYADTKEYDLAIADYNTAIEINPKDADYYYNRGTTYADKEQYDLAITDYNKSIELNPKLAGAFYNKALACEEIGQVDEAIKSYGQFLRYAPGNDKDILNAKQRIHELS